MQKDVSRVQILLSMRQFSFQILCEKVITNKTLPEAIPINRSDSDCITEVGTGCFAGSKVIYDEDKS